MFYKKLCPNPAYVQKHQRDKQNDRQLRIDLAICKFLDDFSIYKLYTSLRHLQEDTNNHFGILLFGDAGTLKFLRQALGGLSHWIFVAVLVCAAFATFASTCIATALASFAARKVVVKRILTASAAWRNTRSPTATATCRAQELGAKTVRALDTLILIALCVCSHRVLVASRWSHTAFASCIHACIATALAALPAAKKIPFVILAARTRRAPIPAAFVFRGAPENTVLFVETRLCTFQLRNRLR